VYVPVLMTKEKDPTNWLTPVEGKINTFKTKEVGFPRDVVLKPFYRTHDLHYTVYWDTSAMKSGLPSKQNMKKNKKRKKKSNEGQSTCSGSVKCNLKGPQF
jgi:hypothetical protein